MAYDFYLGSVKLPIAPESMTLKTSNQNDTVNLVNGEEINILKRPGLTEIDFDARIPQQQYPFASYPDGFMRASYYLDYFEQLKTEKKTFQFIVSRALPSGKLLFDTNLKMCLEEYSIKEDVGDGFDLTVEIRLKQYRDFGTKVCSISADWMTVKESREPGVNEPVPGNTYTVKKGDCLWNIAKSLYGRGSSYDKLYEVNKDQITNPNLIYPGQILVIPE